LGSTHSRHHAEINFRKAAAAAFFFCDADVACHRDLQAAADRMAIDCRNDDLRCIFQAHQDFMAVQCEVVFETE
jgi:hypothetical protein